MFGLAADMLYIPVERPLGAVGGEHISCDPASGTHACDTCTFDVSEICPIRSVHGERRMAACERKP